MHTLTWKDWWTHDEWHVHYNGDWSGDVRVMMNDGTGVDLPFDLMLECVGRYIQDLAIERLESQTGLEIIEAMTKVSRTE